MQRTFNLGHLLTIGTTVCTMCGGLWAVATWVGFVNQSLVYISKEIEENHADVSRQISENKEDINRRMKVLFERQDWTNRLLAIPPDKRTGITPAFPPFPPDGAP